MLIKVTGINFKSIRFIHTLHGVAACLALSMINPAAAQKDVGAASYPERPIRLIDPYAPGGGSGVVARLLSVKLADAWGKQVVVDNRPGAAAAIGTDLAVRAAADGYTLLMGTSGSIAISPHVAKVPYDTLRDLSPISQTSAQAMLVVLHPSLKVDSVKDLIAHVRANPGKVTYSSSGAGGSGHLAAELFESLTKAKMIHVPYKGSGPAVIAVLSGEVQLSFNNILAVLPQVQAGKLKALAVTSAQRARAIPDLPTLAEAGVPGYSATSWNGVFAPAKVPQPIINKIHAEVVKALNATDVRDRLTSMGSDPVGSSPAEFRSLIALEHARWGKVIKENNVKLD
jgi:tripartite-type tricarboxylate transporter receptor subunit TctC